MLNQTIWRKFSKEQLRSGKLSLHSDMNVTLKSCSKASNSEKMSSLGRHEVWLRLLFRASPADDRHLTQPWLTTQGDYGIAKHQSGQLQTWSSKQIWHDQTFSPAVKNPPSRLDLYHFVSTDGLSISIAENELRTDPFHVLQDGLMFLLNLSVQSCESLFVNPSKKRTVTNSSQ